MKVMERIDFFQKYNISPSRVTKLKEGECIKVKRKNLPDRVIKCEKIYGSKGNPTQLILSEHGDKFTLDLSTHWERGGSSDFKLCHEGMVNLIKAIYSQTESDYEALFLAGPDAIPLEKNPGESLKEFHLRLRRVYTQTYKDCEEFLGEVFCRYAKIKALWRVTHDIDKIAERLGETSYHVACVVDRLGLNRTETAQNETF